MAESKMTQDEIIRMAREAGVSVLKNRTGIGETLVLTGTEKLERFAALVAAHEREKTKAVFEELEREVKAELINAINGAVELEREACAKVCEEGTALTAFQSKDCYSYAYNRAAAIRARGEK